YEEIAGQVDPKLAAVWTADVLKGELNYRDIGIDAFKAEDMVQLVSLLLEDKITEQSGIQIIRTILNEGGSPDKIIEAAGLLKAEGDLVTTAVEETIAENPQPIADYQNGKPEALNFVVGQVMKKTKGRADAKSVRELILQKI
ncbi:MAG: Asp-tRNA(Asn)/Glu-tRNA(Gln) amidotransferase GatCAB subunit B, partial [Nitrospirae bacterium]|nr:Asp-tRNA(Asn)/Glu-tRNA(Gln) amidotransferase GatCAB subunit B [Nitrospirota bacterium]